MGGAKAGKKRKSDKNPPSSKKTVVSRNKSLMATYIGANFTSLIQTMLIDDDSLFSSKI